MEENTLSDEQISEICKFFSRPWFLLKKDKDQTTSIRETRNEFHKTSFTIKFIVCGVTIYFNLPRYNTPENKLSRLHQHFNGRISLDLINDFGRIRHWEPLFPEKCASRIMRTALFLFVTNFEEHGIKELKSYSHEPSITKALLKIGFVKESGILKAKPADILRHSNNPRTPYLAWHHSARTPRAVPEDFEEIMKRKPTKSEMKGSHLRGQAVTAQNKKSKKSIQREGGGGGGGGGASGGQRRKTYRRRRR